MRVLTSSSAEQWEAASAEAVVPLRVVRMGPGFKGSLARYDLDDGIWVVDVRSDAHDLARTPQLIDASASDGVLLEINPRGGTVIDQHGRRAVLGPGDGVLYDTCCPYRLALPEQHRAYLLHVPRRLLALTDGVLQEGMARAVGERHASYRLLCGYLDLVLPLAAATTDSGTRSLASRTLADLVAVIASSLAGRGAVASRELLLSALQLTVRRELSNPSLSPAYLAECHHVSVRLVHAAFALSQETPAAYIRARRLERACSLLRDPRLRVVDVAMACGFRETSTFVRVFRRSAGTSPSEFRALHSSDSSA